MSLMEAAVRRAGKGGLDLPVAAVAALAAAAAMVMVPVDILETVVVDTGISSIVSPLEPPLGMKARIAFAALAAAIGFGLVLLLMRALGRAPDMFEPEEKGEAAAATASMPPATPRLRRRDKHPDAPARAPFSVSHDMGDAPFGWSDPEPQPKMKPQLEPVVPAEPVEAVEPAPSAGHPLRRRRPLTEILAGEIERAAAEPAAKPEPVREEPWPVMDEAPEPEPDAEAAEEPAELEAEAAEPAEEPEEEAAEAVAEPAETEEADEELLLAEQAEEEPEPFFEPQLERRDDTRPMIRPAWLDAPVADAAEGEATPPAREESLAELLARFERAMERRQQRPPAAPGDSFQEAPEAMDTRLRSALENLKRFAPRAG